MAQTVTTLKHTVRRGAVAPLMQVGKIEKEITFGGVSTIDADDDVIQVFDFEDDTIVLAAGFEIVTPATNAINVSLGKGVGAECLAASAANSAAGTKYGGGKTPTHFDAGDTLDMDVSGDPGAAGTIRIWAIVADTAPQQGN